MERKLVTIEYVNDIRPIPEADAIVAAHVRGWWVVVKKDEFNVGDKVLYFEIDSFLPTDIPQFEFLHNRGVKTNTEGVVGHVLKTIKLRGQLSQGLLLPLEQFPHLVSLEAGEDVTEALGVSKWEPPLPAQLRGVVRGNFPGFVSKTDAERVQNLANIFPLDERKWYATEKIDGTSATFGLWNDEFWVCSRNMALKEVAGNVYWDIARKLNIESLLREIQDQDYDTIALQGEIFGEGIQNNRLGMKGVHFNAFNFELNGQVVQRKEAMEFLPAIDFVPLRSEFTIPQSVDEAIVQVYGLTSVHNRDRLAEGLVWWNRNPEFREPRNWKAINDKFLLKEK